MGVKIFTFDNRVVSVQIILIRVERPIHHNQTKDSSENLSTAASSEPKIVEETPEKVNKGGGA